MEAPVAARIEISVVPSVVMPSGLHPGFGAAAGLTLAPALAPALSPSFHAESAPAARFAAAARALPAPRPVDSSSESPLLEPHPVHAAVPALAWTARSPREIESPAARIAAGEDRILRSVFGDRPETEAPSSTALTRSGLNAASTRVGAVPVERAPLPESPASRGKDSPLLRLVTGIGLVAVQAALIHWSALAFSLFTAAVSGLMIYEYGSMMARGGRPIQRALAIFTGAGLAAAVAFGMSSVGLMIAAVVVVFREVFGNEHSPDRAALTFMGAFMLGWLPGHMSLIRALDPHGQALTFMYFAAVWATDTFAYIVGKTLGRHRIGPLSPNKTWEGAIGGFLAALATVFAFAHFVPGLLSWRTAALVGAAIGLVGQISGFAASMIKRSTGVKDSGRLLPGHGGFLDRFDSFVFSAPLVYWLLAILR